MGAAPLHTRFGYLYVPVRLGGRATQWLILDTGSYRSYLTARGLARLKASGIKLRTDGETGPLEAKVVGVSLGKASFALDTTGFPQSLDEYSDGIVGMDLLRGRRIGVDPARREFRVWPAAKAARAASREWFASARPVGGRNPRARSTEMWDLGDGTYGVRIDVANLSLPMCVDTGCEESYLARELAPALRPSHKAGSAKATFYTGVERIDYYRVDGYRLEGLSIPANRPLGATNMPNTCGLLGNDVFDRLRLFFDFPGGRLTYAPSVPLKPPGQGPDLRGPSVDLPTGVSIRWPLGEVVRVEPGCEYDAPKGYREVRRPDGTLDLVPSGAKVPTFRVRPRLLVAPTVSGKPVWVDRPAHVPPKAEYTLPPGWTKRRRSDGGLDLLPPRRPAQG